MKHWLLVLETEIYLLLHKKHLVIFCYNFFFMNKLQYKNINIILTKKNSLLFLPMNMTKAFNNEVNV